MDECFALNLPKGKELHFNFNYSLARNDQQLKQFGNILNKSGIRFPASTSLLVCKINWIYPLFYVHPWGWKKLNVEMS